MLRMPAASNSNQESEHQVDKKDFEEQKNE